MQAGPVKLITFAISHYCEVSRWCLDWHRIPYREIGWPPGVHMFLAKRAGLRYSSVPIVIAGDETIQGTGAIFDWAERANQGSHCSLAPGLDRDEAEQIEQRLNRVAGVHVRRFYYAHVLPDRAHYVKPVLFSNTSLPLRMAGLAMWSFTKSRIIKGYRTGGKAIEESRDILNEEFHWLAGLLQDRGTYLDGKAFSRLDLLAASLLSPLAKADEMSIYRQMKKPDDLAAEIETWSQNPAISWVRDIYRKHRNEACMGPEDQAALRAEPVT